MINILKVNIALIVNLLIALTIVYVLWDMPSERELANYKPPITTRVYSEDGYILSEIASENRAFVPLQNVPDIIQNAFVSAEDKYFFEHSGFNYKAIAGAALNNALYALGQRDKIVGGSTLTQQVVKNMLLDNSRTYRRKIREAVLTNKIEKIFPKEYILELYLNEIYLGRGKYGIVVASLEYFNKSLSDLSVAEAAFLASLPQAPAYYDPNKRYSAVKARRDWVINRMMVNGYITLDQAMEAIATPIKVSARSNLKENHSKYASEEIRKAIKDIAKDSNIYEEGMTIKATINTKLQQSAHDALQRGIMDFDHLGGYRGPLGNFIPYESRNTEIFSPDDLLSIRSETQTGANWLYYMNANPVVNEYRHIVSPWRVAGVIDVAQDHVIVGMLSGDIKTVHIEGSKWAYPANTTKKNLEDFRTILQIGDIVVVNETSKGSLELMQIPEVNGALVAMDVSTGAILAMEGGFSFELSKFNRATQAKRQPGSLFKPFVYLPALEKGYNPTSKFLDAPLVFEDGKGGNYQPTNYKDAYAGFVSIRNGITSSRNFVTLRVANTIGLKSISNTAMKFGIYDEPLGDITAALGSHETTLVKMLAAYAALANGGKKVEPFLIRQFNDRQGTLRYKSKNIDCGECSGVAWQNQPPPVLQEEQEQLTDPRYAYQLVNIMEGAVNYGTGYRARVRNVVIAGKTGTTNDSYDTWFVGFTPDIAVAIYVGYDLPKSLGDNASGSNVAAPIFNYFMSQVSTYYPPRPFEIPGGLEFVWVDRETGDLLGSSSVDKGVMEAILEGTKDSIAQDDDLPASINENSEYFEGEFLEYYEQR